MIKKTLQTVTILAVFALMGTMGWAVLATSGDAASSPGCFFQHLHKMAEHLHHGGSHPNGMMPLVERLELTPEQFQHLLKVHEIIGACGGEGHADLEALHEQVVAQVAAGEVEVDGIHAMIDEHLEQMRGVAYGVADELVALVHGLDAKQREMLLAHLEGRHGGHGGSDGHGGHGH